MTDEHLTTPERQEPNYPASDFSTPEDISRALTAWGDAVPVTIIDTEPKNTNREWNGFSMAVSARAQELLGADPRRRYLRIVNAGTNNVYLGPNNQVSVAFGFRLAPILTEGLPYENYSNGRIWAVCATGETATLYISVEWEGE